MLDAVEALEDVREVFVGDADAAIGYFDRRNVPVRVPGNDDRRTRIRKLHGIVQQMAHDFAKELAIARNAHAVGRARNGVEVAIELHRRDGGVNNIA